MELQAPRNDGGQQGIGRRRRQNERRRAGWLLEDFQENVGDVLAHRFCAVENEHAAATHGLKIGRALHRS